MQRMIPGVSWVGLTAVAGFVAVVLVALQIAGDGAQQVLRWDRAALQEFQLWRVWTGHLVHASWPHLGMNLLGLMLVVWLFPEPLSARWQLLRLMWLMLFISAMMLAAHPELGWYVGLSGVLHGAFVFGLWWMIRHGDRLALLLLLGLMVKLGYEHYYGPISSDEELIGVPVLTAAHSYGALGAVLWIVMATGWRWPRRLSNNPRP